MRWLRHAPLRWRLAPAFVFAAALASASRAAAQSGIAIDAASSAPVSPGAPPPALADAQRLFYNARYEAASALTLSLREAANPADGDALDEMASAELRSSAILFQLKGLLEGRAGKVEYKNCPTCPALVAEFLAETSRGQTLARTRLAAAPADRDALFYLAKLDLNYVWLQLGPLHKKTGWKEYWEARRSLDVVIKENPRHVRARVARAWIDYIVDTRMPWGARWMLGGGDRKRALSAVREAATMDADFFAHTEAEFALWDMHVRERDLPHALEVAQRLAEQFPDNPEVAQFLASPEAGAVRH